MPEIDPVILQLRAEVSKYRADVVATTNFVEASLARQEHALVQLDKQASLSSGRISQSFSSLKTNVNGYLAGFAFGVVIRQMASLTDQSKQLDAQLKLATTGFGTFNQAQGDVQRIADETRTSLEATAGLYGSFARSFKELGRTPAEAAKATEAFSKALAIGGATSEDAANATRQFGQALAGGILRAEEFNSVVEASPRVARALADSLGVSIGQLRNLVNEGKVSASQLADAFTNAKITAGLDAEFKTLPTTFDQAMTKIYNAAIITFGAFDKGGQFSDAIVNMLTQGTTSFQGIAKEASAAGIEIRAVFSTLGDVFAPIIAAGRKAFASVRTEANYTRDTIANVLSGFDQLDNLFIKLGNRATSFDNSAKGVLNEAMRRAGNKGQGFAINPLTPQADRAGNFLRGFNAATKAGQARVNAAPPSTGTSSPRPRPAPGVTRSGSGAGRRSGSGSTAATAAVADPSVALLAQIRKDLLDIEQRSGSVIQTETERLKRASALFRGVFGDEGQDSLTETTKKYDEEKRLKIEAATQADEAAKAVQANNILELADLYESLFQEGTDGVWRNFKDQGLRALALVAAQATIASFSKGGGGFGSILSNVASSAQAFFSKSGTPGRASGGYVGPGQTVRVNEGASSGVELLRMGSQGGTVIPLGQAKAQRAAASTTVLQTIAVDARGAVMNDQFASQILARAGQDARQVVNANNGAIRKSLPGTQARLNQLGTTG